MEFFLLYVRSHGIEEKRYTGIFAQKKWKETLHPPRKVLFVKKFICTAYYSFGQPEEISVMEWQLGHGKVVK